MLLRLGAVAAAAAAAAAQAPDAQITVNWGSTVLVSKTETALQVSGARLHDWGRTGMDELGWGVSGRALPSPRTPVLPVP
jgi:hypothetical protein